MTALLALALLAAGSPAGPRDGLPAVREQARYVMGTLATVRAEAPGAAAAEAAVDAAWTAFARIDSLMSTWREDSDLSRVNREAAAGWVPVDPEVVTVVAAALDLAAESGGAFDPTVLPLMRAWGLRGGEPRRPPAAVLDSLLRVTGAGLVSVDRDAAAIRFRRPGVALDLGGIAKGHALDAARAAMVRAGARAGVLDLGGNLLVFGGDAGDSVGIVAPDDPSRLVTRVALAEGSVATSGQYERFVEIDGEAWGHILDPRTGLSVRRVGSVTVTAPDGRTADALATALFVLGPDEGAALVARRAGVAATYVLPGDDGNWRVLTVPAAGPVRTR